MSRRYFLVAVWFVLIAGVLGLVASMYVQPDFVVNVANQVWACF